MDRKERLSKAVEYHGHLCMGQVLGVLLAEKGLSLIGTADPREMIVIAENDRCIADALQILTGTRLGRRSFKLRDYGKMAATFINLRTGHAYRVWVSGAVTKTGEYHSLQEVEKEALLARVIEAGIDEVLSFQPVRVHLSPDELPGYPRRVVRCAVCGEKVMDAKETERDGRLLCRACADRPYYTTGDEDADHRTPP
ncbi:MAG: FmdE family protein [Candidatus Thermoplasmatota archaeon]